MIVRLAVDRHRACQLVDCRVQDSSTWISPTALYSISMIHLGGDRQVNSGYCGHPAQASAIIRADDAPRAAWISWLRAIQDTAAKPIGRRESDSRAADGTEKLLKGDEIFHSLRPHLDPDAPILDSIVESPTNSQVVGAVVKQMIVVAGYADGTPRLLASNGYVRDWRSGVCRRGGSRGSKTNGARSRANS